jgi:hypothetical protein
MAYDNSGIIGKNERKQKDNHPDIQGQATIDGAEFWISGWKKEKDGKGFYSLAFKPKEVKPELTDDYKNAPRDLDDDIPF